MWINLPNLPRHFYEWAALYRNIGPIDNPIMMGKVIASKMRQTISKISVKIDLTKPLIHVVYKEFKESRKYLPRKLNMRLFLYSILPAKSKNM